MVFEVVHAEENEVKWLQLPVFQRVSPWCSPGKMCLSSALPGVTPCGLPSHVGKQGCSAGLFSCEALSWVRAVWWCHQAGCAENKIFDTLDGSFCCLYKAWKSLQMSYLLLLLY